MGSLTLDSLVTLLDVRALDSDNVDLLTLDSDVTDCEVRAWV